jgi:hypothetical protein
MKESSYWGSLRQKLVEEVGGKCIKIADVATLGLPDSIHIHTGIATFIETKIGDEKATPVHPWFILKHDVRQFEVCKRIALNALVLYVIYYPEIRMTAVFQPAHLEPILDTGPSLVRGHGISAIKKEMEQYRRMIYESGRLRSTS